MEFEGRPNQFVIIFIFTYLCSLWVLTIIEEVPNNGLQFHVISLSSHFVVDPKKKNPNKRSKQSQIQQQRAIYNVDKWGY